MRIPFVRPAGVLLALTLAVSACGNDNSRSTTSTPSHIYSTSIKAMDTPPLVLDGCPTTLWIVQNRANDNRADFPDVTDRVYVAHCPTVTTTTAVQPCGKSCQISVPHVSPTDGGARAATVPSPTLDRQALVQALRALPPDVAVKVLAEALNPTSATSVPVAAAASTPR